MHQRSSPYPIVGELNDPTWEKLAGGQPLAMCRQGRPVAVLIDLDSWAEVEAALGLDLGDL